MAHDAVSRDFTTVPVSSGPSTKRSRVSRKTEAPVAIKTKTPPRVVKARARTGAKPGPKTTTRARAEAPERRTSEILRQILTDNPQDKISVEQILKSMGTSSFGTSIMVFSIPEVIPIPVPGLAAIVVLPAGILAAQMIAGKGEVRLPKALLKRTIPRKVFAAAVKAILPHLERAEKQVRPRWQWATSPAAKRFLGAFILLLAGFMSLPIPMTNVPPAIAMFIIGMGLAERDGKLIALGVSLGLASMALVGGAIFGLFSLFGGAA
jgi:hypothetical protein